MKANRSACGFLFLFLVLTLQGSGHANDATSAEKTPSVTTTNNSTGGGNDAARTFNETKVLAEHGDVKAQFKLGNCYYKGDGVATNYVEAVKWYRKAAEQNYGKAQSYPRMTQKP
jgi:TPR repeat protein